MKTLILPDLHNKVDCADRLIASLRPDEVVFLGDYFDSFDDTPEDALHTAKWLKSNIRRPNFHFILGNHDAAYRWPKTNWTECAGYTKEKQSAIDSVLTDEDWQRTLFAVERGNCWMSHAGLHPAHFSHPVLGFVPERTWEILHKAEFETSVGIYTPITDEKRATNQVPSGPLWLRWEDFEPIEEINQVVGHTWNKDPQIIQSGESKNINIDTIAAYYAVLEDGEISIEKNPFAPINQMEQKQSFTVGEKMQVPASNNFQSLPKSPVVAF